MKKQLRSFLPALLITIGFGLPANAQSDPSVIASNNSKGTTHTQVNGNYLGLLGLLGLYGLKKGRRQSGTVIDRPAI